MTDDRRRTALFMVVLLALGGLLAWWAGRTATDAVSRAYAPYNARLKAAKFEPLNIIPDAFKAHTTEGVGQVYPNTSAVKGQPCGSNCLALRTVQGVKLAGVLPLPWAGGAGLGLLLLGGLLAVGVFAPNPRKNLINHQRDRVKLRTQGNVLPIVQVGGTRWGLMRRAPKGGGRREYGNAVFIGAPGRGKSSLLKWWLLTADMLNFVVLDLKGDLWTTTAGHRAELGRVIRFDLTSMKGDALDPLDTDDKGTAQAVINAFLPSNTGEKSDYFNKLAAEIALAYWAAARQTGQSAIPVLVRAATSPTRAMLKLARGLVALAPVQARDDLLRGFETAFGAIWDDPAAAAGGERGSVVQSFKAGFAGLNTPEILSTLCRTTFDPSELVEERATVYISAPSTEPPYKAPLETLMGAVIQAVTRYVDRERQGSQGEDIVILADEAGILRVPQFAETLAGGRSRGITLTAFLQSMGQLDQYHKRGWRGIVDTIHHWTWWNTNDPDAHAFLRQRCGVYDKPNPSRDAEEKQRRPHIEAHAYDEISPRWKETEVLSLLDFDRTYPVFGRAVNPYQNRRLKAEMQQPTPELDPLPRIPAVQVAPDQNNTPPAAPPTPKRPTPPKLPPRPVQPQKSEEADEDETF